MKSKLLSITPVLWYGSGEQSPLLGATPEPTRLWLNLDALTPLMFKFGYLGLHLVYTPLVLHAVASSHNSCFLVHMPEYYL
jgi:hypothetical protein